MQVKTFIGSNNKEVLDQIKAELGSEAVILESKNFQENGKKMVRMTAALDRAGAPAQKSSAMPSYTGAHNGHWAEEWSEIKRHLFSLMKPALRLDLLEGRQRAAIEYLEQDGAGDQALLELYRRLSGNQSLSVLVPLTDMLPVKPWGLDEWPQRVHLVAGPFGSGKTTTAVRMALVLQKMRPGLRICIVNADAERGNGRLLLRHYAGLSDLIYREVSGPMEMAGVVAEINSQGFDKVIVDLPGLGRKQSMTDLLGILALDRVDVSIAMHLIFSPHYSGEMQLRLLERYHADLPGSIIWSKLDESVRFGSILNLAVASSLPISAFSFGPGLLNTLLPAERVALWKILFKHELPMAATSGK